jgi:hypothetical protein
MIDRAKEFRARIPFAKIVPDRGKSILIRITTRNRTESALKTALTVGRLFFTVGRGGSI